MICLAIPVGEDRGEPPVRVPDTPQRKRWVAGVRLTSHQARVLGRGLFLQRDLGIDRKLGAQLLDDADPILREQGRVI